MKIGVVADTHSLALPKQMLDDFKNVDLIIHAGDFCSMKVIEKLKKIKEVAINDILEVANDIFRPDKLNLAIIGPLEKPEPFANLLKI